MPRPRKPRVWKQIATTSVPDPRDPNLPHVVVTQLLDNDGRHWEKWGDEKPVLLGGVPDITAKP